jgi:hypothetical protein
MNFTLLEVVKIYDFESFVVNNGVDEYSFQFRLEIIRNLSTNTYTGKVYQFNTFRIQPTFSQTGGYPSDFDSDESIYVADNIVDSNLLIGRSINEVIGSFQKTLHEVLKNPDAGVNSQMNPTLEIVKTFDFEPHIVIDDEPYRYRLEIAYDLRTHDYIGKVYRLETYRLQPTFPQANGNLPDRLDDVLVFVSDHIIDSLIGESIDKVVEKFQKSFHDFFK